MRLERRCRRASNSFLKREFAIWRRDSFSTHAKLLRRYVEELGSSGVPVGSSAPTTDKYYIAQIHGLRIYSLSTLYVDYEHLSSVQDGVLAGAVVEQYYRFLPFLTRGLHNLIAKYEPRYFKEHRQPTTSSQQTSSTVVNGAN